MRRIVGAGVRGRDRRMVRAPLVSRLAPIVVVCGNYLNLRLLIEIGTFEIIG